MKTFQEIWLSLFQESGRRAALNDCCGRHVTVKSNYLGCFIETTFFVRFIKMAFQPSSERTQILVHCFAVRQEDWSIEVSNIFQNRNTKQINSRTKGTTILFLFMYIKGPLIIPVRKRKGTDYARHLTIQYLITQLDFQSFLQSPVLYTVGF